MCDLGLADIVLKFATSDVHLQIGDDSDVDLSLSGTLNESAELIFTYSTNEDLIAPLPNLTVYPGNTSLPVHIIGQHAGHITLGVNSSSPEFEHLEDTFVRIDVVHSSILVVINAVIGWMYFVAWSISFYPQIYINFKRKSVDGLNFDFLLYNITGFLAYAFFNVGMFWVDKVKGEYHDQHPRGINPVQLNDVIFTLHAVFITAVTIGQCFIFDRGSQRLSKVAIILTSGAWLFAGIALIVTLTHKITWLTYLYYFSYIKLGVTLIKYVPQAYQNYRRKSTRGWSIGNVLLDCTGGMLSLLQMFLLAYNSDDWASIFGDPTKFGLGFFSILFDILFIVQHYVLYRGRDDYDILQESREVDVVVNVPTQTANKV